MSKQPDKELEDILRESLDTLQQEAVDWHEECEADIKLTGYPCGDGKELRRARKWVENTIDVMATKAQLQLVDELMEQAVEVNTIQYNYVNGDKMVGGFTNSAVPIPVLQQYKANLSGKGE